MKSGRALSQQARAVAQLSRMDVQANGVLPEGKKPHLVAREAGQKGVERGRSGGHLWSLSLEDETWRHAMTTTFSSILSQLNPSAVLDALVIRFKAPDVLAREVGISLDDDGTKDDFAGLLHSIVENSAKTAHPLFLNQLFAGAEPYGLAAAVLTEALNTSAYTYDVAPVFTLMEREVVRKLNLLCGFPDGDGISCPGGSISNMYALNLARFARDSSVKSRGLSGDKRLRVFVSAQAHYSFLKGMAFMGLGTDNLITVPCDSWGRMIPAELDRLMEESAADADAHNLMVVATSGTTVLNAFDPIHRIAPICRRRGVWLHVDAALGGCYMLSEEHKEQFMQGVERADSVTWNWHKVLGAPLQTSMFLTPHKGLLKQAHAASASYLFHREKHYDTALDTGDASIQCGRKPDAFKIWLMWKMRGKDFLGHQIRRTAALAQWMAERLESNPRFRLVLPRAQASTVCFWVVPPRLGRLPRDSPEYWREVGGVALRLKKRMVERGLAQVTYQPLPDQGLPEFFRCTLLTYPPLSEEDVEDLINIMVTLSDDL